MNFREALIAALRGDPDLRSKVRKSLRERIDEEQGPMSTVVQAAEALEPIIAGAVEKRPSRLGKLGLKSAHLLAGLAVEDERSSRRLERMAGGSTVGIVFVDVAGFTALTAAIGDDAAIALLDELGAIVDRAARAAKGECVKSLGDGFLLAFPSASQAVRGGVSISREVERRRRGNGFELHVRVAVHAGEPLISEDDLLGHDVNLTARLLDHCKPGEVVVSEVAKELAEKRLKKIEFGKRRRVHVRGLAGRVAIYPANFSDPSTRTK